MFKNTKYRQLFIFAFFFIAGFCYAQSGGIAQLVSVQGSSFTIISGDQEQQFTAQQLSGKGIFLKSSDIAQTGPGSFMDISILPGGTNIKLAENTSLVFNGPLPGNNSLAVTLVYGRILVKHGKIGTSIFVQTGASVTEIENGDINVDYTVLPFVQPPGRPSLLVASLSGTAILSPRATMPELGRIVIKKGDSIFVDSLLNNVERVKTDKALAEYWDKRQFKYPARYEPGIHLDPSSAEKTNEGYEYNPGDPEESVYIVPYKADRLDSKVRSAGVVTGLAVMLLGVVAQGAMHFMESTQIPKNQADVIFYAGFAPIGIGTFILIASSSYKPRETMPIPALESNGSLHQTKRR